MKVVKSLKNHYLLYNKKVKKFLIKIFHFYYFTFDKLPFEGLYNIAIDLFIFEEDDSCNFYLIEEIEICKY